MKRFRHWLIRLLLTGDERFYFRLAMQRHCDTVKDAARVGGIPLASVQIALREVERVQDALRIVADKPLDPR